MSRGDRFIDQLEKALPVIFFAGLIGSGIAAVMSLAVAGLIFYALLRVTGLVA